MNILIINGPNLNLIGKREPEIYGNASFDEFLSTIKNQYPSVKIDYFQSNIEGELIDVIQKADKNYDGIILNPGAYAYTSVAIADAVKAVSVPVIEVHISNIYAREEFRKYSVIANACKGMITGLGLSVYYLALTYFIDVNK